MRGWIKLHRQIMEHPYFLEERVFSRYEAWSHLIMMVNHADNKTIIDGSMVEVPRGSVITSVRKLQDRWKWSNTKTIRFLNELEDEGMIVKKSDTKKTVITLINYDIYQGEEEEKRHENDAKTTQKRTNKNVNKESIKNLYGVHVLLTDEQHAKLITDLTEPVVSRLIEDINYWFTQKPTRIKDYKDHNLMIRKWNKTNLRGNKPESRNTTAALPLYKPDETRNEAYDRAMAERSKRNGTRGAAWDTDSAS